MNQKNGNFLHWNFDKREKKSKLYADFFSQHRVKRYSMSTFPGNFFIMEVSSLIFYISFREIVHWFRFAILCIERVFYFCTTTWENHEGC